MQIYNVLGHEELRIEDCRRCGKDRLRSLVVLPRRLRSLVQELGVGLTALQG